MVDLVGFSDKLKCSMRNLPSCVCGFCVWVYMYTRESQCLHSLYCIGAYAYELCVSSIHDGGVASTELCLTTECVMPNFLTFSSIRRMHFEVLVRTLRYHHLVMSENVCLSVAFGAAALNLPLLYPKIVSFLELCDRRKQWKRRVPESSPVLLLNSV